MNDRLKEIQSEVDVMNKSFDEGIATETPGTETPGTSAPGTAAPGTSAPGTSAPSTESPSTAAPSTEAPATEVPDEKDQIIANLRAEIAKGKGPKTETPGTKAPTTEAPLVLDEQDFLGDLDLDDISRDPKELNKLLNKLYQKAVTNTRKVLGEGVLRSIPDIVKANVAVIANLQKANEQFYTDNEDLKPFKKVVATVFEELASENPDKKYDEILPDVGNEVRKRLELHKKAASPTKDKGNLPKLPRKKGKSGQALDKPNITPIENEIGEMNETLGR